VIVTATANWTYASEATMGLYTAVLSGASTVQTGAATTATVNETNATIILTPVFGNSYVFEIASVYDANTYADFSMDAGTSIINFFGETSNVSDLNSAFTWVVQSSTATTARTPVSLGVDYSGSYTGPNTWTAAEVAASGSLTISTSGSTISGFLPNPGTGNQVPSSGSFAPAGGVVLAFAAATTFYPGYDENMRLMQNLDQRY
jgi:hypothetical protein